MLGRIFVLLQMNFKFTGVTDTNGSCMQPIFIMHTLVILKVDDLTVL